MDNYIPLKARTKENDIKYRAPLSYRYLRIIAWVCLAIAQVAVVFRFGARIDPTLQKSLGVWADVLTLFSELPLPLFLLANLALIMQRREKFRNMLIKFGGLALMMYILANFLVLQYGFRSARLVISDLSYWSFSNFVSTSLVSMGKIAYSLNIFIDLFLFALTMFFLNYKPKKVFTGKKVYIFRSFVLLPLFYEIASIILKGFAVAGTIIIPVPFFFLLTSKPPMLFLAFFALLVIMKFREFKHLKKHDDIQLLKEHYETNAHSLRVSITISVIISIAAVLDAIISIILTFYYVVTFAKDLPAFDAVNAGLKFTEHIGFGWVSPILLVPIIMLFSYTKKHKNPNIDLFIPAAGVGLIAIIYLEGMYEVINFTFGEFIKRVKEFLNKYFNYICGDGEEEAPAQLGSVEPQSLIRVATNAIKNFLHL